MKSSVCWRKKFFLFGMIILSMLFIIACSDSGDDSNPFDNQGYNQGEKDKAPYITSDDNTIFAIGLAESFKVIASGEPTPTIALTGGILPTGVTFDAKTRRLSGTPAAGTNGTYNLIFTASNGVLPDATQNFTLTVVLPVYPIITSSNRVTFSEGHARTFTFTATGNPAPTFTLTGTLPSGVTFDANTHKLSGTPAAGTTGTYPLTVIATNGVSPDAIQNFTLTVRVGLPPFNTSCLPLVVTGFGSNAFGSFTFDDNGNLLFTGNWMNEIRSLDRITCSVTTVATGVSGSHLLGMTYDQGSIYVGADGLNIYKVDPTTGASTLLTNVSSTPNGLAVAPDTFGSYGGQLIVATYSGNIYAVNQAVASPTPVLIADIGNTANALVFGSDGTLYVTDYGNNKIVTVTAAGVVADFVTTGLSGNDGIAIDNVGGYLYVVNSSDGTLKRVTIPGGIVSTVMSASFDGGWYPSPILYDEDSDILFMGTNPGTYTIIYYGP